MKHLSAFFLLFLGPPLTAQMLPGYVTLQNSDGRSAAPATVSAPGATATTVRDADGFFQLVFDAKRPGQDVEHAVEKPGYEVVNYEALPARLPDTAAGAPPLRIYLCPKGQWRRFADQYYETNQADIRSRFERRIQAAQQRLNAADSAGRALADTIARLHSERDAALELLKGYAEQLARTNLDDVSERYRLAFRLFSEGRLDSFLLLVREKDIRADLDRAAAAVQQARALGQSGSAKVAAGLELRRRTLEELIIRARTLAVTGQWSDADRTFGIAVQEDSTNRAVLYEYFRFKRNRMRYAEARQLAERMLALGGSPADSARLWYDLGRCSAALFEYDHALDAYQKSEHLYRGVSKRNPYLLPVYAEMLGKMAGTYRAMGDHTSARRQNEESLSILERAARILKIAGTMLPAQMLQIGDEYANLQDFTRAEASYLRAGELMRQSADTLSREYQEWTMHQGMALANTYLNTNRPHLAIAQLNTLWSRSAADAQRDPDRYLWEYITITAFFGNAQLSQENMGEAERLLVMADSMIGQAGKPLSPYLQEIQRQVVRNLGEIGFILANRTDCFFVEHSSVHPDTVAQAHTGQVRAMQYADKAAEFFPELEDFTSAALLPRFNLSLIFLAMNDSVSAERYRLQCRPLYEYANTAPDGFKVRLARAENAFGTYFFQRQRLAKARMHLNIALEIFESIEQPTDTVLILDCYNALQATEASMQLYKISRSDAYRSEAFAYLAAAERRLGKLPKENKHKAKIRKAIQETRRRLKSER